MELSILVVNPDPGEGSLEAALNSSSFIQTLPTLADMKIKILCLVEV